MLANQLFKLFFAASAAVLISSCSDSKTSEATVVYTYKVVKDYPHDREAFTEGLAFENGFLYEGTGLNGSSTLRKVELETGNILQLHKLPAEFFGEGVTIYRDRIIQLTYRSNVGFVYNKDSFELLQKFDYPTEGWGLTNDGKHLIMSDGTSALYFLDPQTFREVSRINVHDKNGPVSGLNELEYVKGEIYANVWPTERIARIDPGTGSVVGWIYLKGLSNLPNENRDNVLNGIAYDPAGDRLFVTGKFWPKLFEIKLVLLNY